MAKVLAVLSGGYTDVENNYVTGWWAEELFAPAMELEKEGHTVGVASLLGGKPVVDPLSISEDFDPDGKYKKLYPESLIKRLRSSMSKRVTMMRFSSLADMGPCLIWPIAKSCTI